MKYLFLSTIIRIAIRNDQKERVIHKIRKFAVKSLRKTTESIDFIILQLVACLKYEKFKKKKSPLVKYLLNAISEKPRLASKIYFALQVESNTPMMIIKGWYRKLTSYFLEEINKSKGPASTEIANSIMFREVLSEAYKTSILGNKGISSKEVILQGKVFINFNQRLKNERNIKQ